MPISTKQFLVMAAMLLSSAAVAQGSASVEQAAHGAYLAAINSNDVDKLMAELTDDIVYQAPGRPAIAGKAAVREWINGYLAA